MSMHYVDPRVDDYITSLPEWQQEICQTARRLVHESDPEVTETIKRRIYPYFELNGNIIALMRTKDLVNIFDPIAPDPEGIINTGHGNKTGRGIQVYQNDPINENALLNLFKEVIKNNKAGGWRKIKTNKR